MNRIDLTGQRFGNRIVVKDKCVAEDWERINKPIPSEMSKYSLCKCTNCGAIIPTDRRRIFSNPPKRCVFCSNIGNHYNLNTSTNSWVINSDTAICNVLYQGKVVSFVIDADDYDLVSQKTWRISKKKNKFYVVSGSFKKKTSVYLHQLIMNETKDGMEIDHIDGNSLNNRKSNLRFVTHQENVDNLKATRIDNSIGIRGISRDKRSKKYIVDFNYHGQRIYFKPWKTIEEAVYCRKCVEEIFGLNLVNSNPISKYYELNNSDVKSEIEKYVFSKVNTAKAAV